MHTSYGMRRLALVFDFPILQCTYGILDMYRGEAEAVVAIPF